MMRDFSAAFGPATKERAMKLTIGLTTTRSKSIVSGVLIAASLAFTASTAMAAATHKTAGAHHVVHTRHVASVKRGAVAGLEPGPAQLFGGFFGLPFSIATYAAPKVTAHAVRDGSGYDPTFDSPSPTVEVDNSQSQAAIDASDQAMQLEDQSLNDLDASIAASQAQNDAANAATQQYLINNGM
jgi:hypothetical protein